ncbi:hypothetical protein QLS71_000505 [Mariniflexile litorale]|uniref:Cupin domain-containing protein n=1 Tax=Mariniflexile litorale TaxID=3045158 RepID=A0AAU7EFX1_9FLAO|nr:hypothetical protein [Mariniflexile sp. KMM 9835]MDQ8211976.1 hypothetical protein [Mariniflexile sp. KMM 9835]
MDFKITRVYSDTKGETHFEDLNIPLNNKGDIGFLSEAQKANTIIFRKVTETYDYNFHVSPSRQYVILLDGEIEIETSLGDKRTFQSGEILLLEDITGKGHKTKNIKTQVRSSLFIEL